MCKFDDIPVPSSTSSIKKSFVSLPFLYVWRDRHQSSVRRFYCSNDQVHRARGPTGLTIEQQKSVNEAEDVEKPKDERAPVQRLVMPSARGSPPRPCGRERLLPRCIPEKQGRSDPQRGEEPSQNQDIPRPDRPRGAQGESFLGRKWLIGKKIKKELDKPEGISHAKMV